jgi:hypothetical protein
MLAGTNYRAHFLEIVLHYLALPCLAIQFDVLIEGRKVSCVCCASRVCLHSYSERSMHVCTSNTIISLATCNVIQLVTIVI